MHGIARAGWGLLLLLAACGAPPPALQADPPKVQAAADQRLLAAGFRPAAQATPANLPAQRFVAAPGQPGRWLYADPEVCRCVYAGDQAAYVRYHAAEYRADIADERQRARTPDPSAVAELNNNNEGAAGSLGY